MWCQAGFEPDRFWEQTPRHFQLAMRGARKRISNAADSQLRQAWWTGAFTGLTQSKDGLKPLKHYLRRGPQRKTPAQLHRMFKSMQARGMPMTIRKVCRRKPRAKTGD